MSDALGLLTLPVAAPIVYPPTERTRTPGDPALEVIGSFAATALQADCGAAWTALAPGKPSIASGVTADRDGASAARRVFFSDPRLGYFNDADLPALFVYRSAYLPYTRAAQDAHRRRSQIGIVWMLPRADVDPQRRERDPFIAAIAACLEKAIVERRHPAWVVDSDLADADALKTSFATSTSAQTIATFNGARAGEMMVPPRAITVTTAAAVGAYNTTDPIVVSGVVESGEAFHWSISLTDPDGGETVGTIFDFATPTSVALPAMLTTSGAIEIGYAASSDARKGTLVQRAGCFVEWRPHQAVFAPIPVRRQGTDPVPFLALEMRLDVGEDHWFDPDQRAFTPWDIETHGFRSDLDEEVFEFLIEG